MDLNRDAMLVGLRITAWSGRLYDRQASDHVAAHHDASASAGRYNKRLLPKAAFAALTATMSEARTKHYENSLPWDDKGARLLTVANYEHYTELMNALRERVVRQRARFIEDYDDYVDRARLDLGKLFRIEDYPSKEALQGKFAIRYRITPVPDADHFIAKLASDDTDRVKRDIERHIEEQLHDAVGDLYRRLGEAVGRVSDRLQEDDNGKPLVFRNSMIENIRDLVDVVPRLNIFGRRRACAALRAGQGPHRERGARRAPAVEDVRPGGQDAGQARRGRARGEVRGLLRAPARADAGGRLMSARVLAESALRVSDCVTELLRKQPFFGSLVLRLPLRPDFSRETLATDGHEIRYSPRWVAETDSHLIESAMARVVMACALKHHTRRGERDPERWQMASQLVTHALIRDAGFTLPPDAQAWDGITVEQAYDRLQAEDGDAGDDGNPSPDAGAAGAARRPRPGNPHLTPMMTTPATRPIPPVTTIAGTRTATAIPEATTDRTGTATARAGTATTQPTRGRPMRRRVTILPAPGRSWTRMPAPATTASPPRRPATSPPRSRRGTRRCTRPSISRGPRARCRAGSRRPSGARMRARSTGARSFAAT